MFEVLIKVIPLNLASTLSPGLFAVSLILLGSKKHSKSRLLAFLAGAVLVGVITIYLGYTLTQSISSASEKQKMIKAVVDLILGVIFLIFGFKTLLSQERKVKLKGEFEPKLLKWFLAGIVICATNFDAVILSFTAAHTVSYSTDIGDFSKMILYLINLFFITLPISLPLIFSLFAAKLAQRILPPINQFVFKYSKYIIFIIFVFFGSFLLYRGAIVFLG